MTHTKLHDNQTLYSNQGLKISTSQEATILKTKVTEHSPVAFKHDLIQECGPGLFDTHYPVELGIITQGQLKRSSGDWSAEFNVGDLYLCGIWEPHQSYVVKAPYECCILHFDPVFLTQQLLDDSNQVNLLTAFLTSVESRVHPASEHAQLWLNYAQKLLDLNISKIPNKKLKLKHIGIELISDLISIYKINQDSSNAAHSQNLSGLFDYVFQHKGVCSLEQASKIQKVNKK